MARERAARLSRGRVPEPDRPVARCRRHQFAVRRECHGLDPTRMTLERAARRSDLKVTNAALFHFEDVLSSVNSLSRLLLRYIHSPSRQVNSCTIEFVLECLDFRVM